MHVLLCMLILDHSLKYVFGNAHIHILHGLVRLHHTQLISLGSDTRSCFNTTDNYVNSCEIWTKLFFSVSLCIFWHGGTSFRRMGTGVQCNNPS